MDGHTCAGSWGAVYTGVNGDVTLVGFYRDSTQPSSRRFEGREDGSDQGVGGEEGCLEGKQDSGEEIGKKIVVINRERGHRFRDVWRGMVV